MPTNHTGTVGALTDADPIVVSNPNDGEDLTAASNATAPSKLADFLALVKTLFGRLAGNNTWTGTQTFSGAVTANAAATFGAAVTFGGAVVFPAAGTVDFQGSTAFSGAASVHAFAGHIDVDKGVNATAVGSDPAVSAFASPASSGPGVYAQSAGTGPPLKVGWNSVRGNANFATTVGDPGAGTVQDGDMWIRSDTHQLCIRMGGTTYRVTLT